MSKEGTPRFRDVLESEIKRESDLLVRLNESLKGCDEADAVPSIADDVRRWIASVTKLGKRIGSPTHRQLLQARINHWTTRLRRYGEWSGVAILEPFDESIGEEIPDNLCPYPGLRPCREGDVFAGSEQDVNACFEHIQANRFLAIVGQSGSGKSSIVFAGLVPLLRAWVQAKGWLYLCRPLNADVTAQTTKGTRVGLTPGAHPLRSLVDAVGAHAAREAHWRNTSVARLLSNPSQAPQWLAEAIPEKTLFVFIDQFEEMFSLCSDATERNAAAMVLLSLADDAHSEHRIVITMRSDHYVELEKMLPDLHKKVVKNLKVPTDMTVADLHRVIEEPARHLTPELFFSPPSLVDKIAREAENLPSKLPLLQYALTKLWQHRKKDKITQESYAQLSNVKEALAKAADKLYGMLSPQEQLVCRRMMIELAVIVRFEEPLRRRLLESDLLARLHKAQIKCNDPGSVVEQFCNAGLLVRSGRDAETQIEVAHESLFRNWELFFHDWLPTEKRNMLLRQSIEAAALDWKIQVDKKAGNAEDLLTLKGERLEDAKKLCDEGRLDQSAENFVKHCEDFAKAQLENEEKLKSDKEAALNAREEAVKRERMALDDRTAALAEKNRAYLFASGAALFALLLMVFGYMYIQSREASHIEALSVAGKVLATAPPLTALDYVLTAMDKTPKDKDEDARMMLARALHATDRMTVFPRKDIGGNFTTGGHYYMQMDSQGGGQWIANKIDGDKSVPLSFKAIDQDPRNLVSSDITPHGKKAIFVWKGKDYPSVWFCSIDWTKEKADCPESSRHQLDKGDQVISTSMDWSGERFVVATNLGKQVVFDLSDPGQKLIATESSLDVVLVGMIDPMKKPLLGFKNGNVRLPDGEVVPLKNNAPVNRVFVGPTANRFLTFDDNLNLLIWDTSKRPVQPQLLASGELVEAATFNREAKRVMAVVNRSLRCWKLNDNGTTWQLDVSCGSVNNIFQAAFANEGNAVLWSKTGTGAVAKQNLREILPSGIWASNGTTALWYQQSQSQHGGESTKCPVLHKERVAHDVTNGLELGLPDACIPSSNGTKSHKPKSMIDLAVPSADGRWIAYASRSRTSDVKWVSLSGADGKSDERLAYPRTSDWRVGGLAVGSAADGSWPLVMMAGDSDVYLYQRTNGRWEAMKGAAPFSLPPSRSNTDRISCVAVSPEGGRLVVGTFGGQLFTGLQQEKLWKVEKRTADPSELSSSVDVCSINSAGRAAVGTVNGGVYALEPSGRPEELTPKLRRLPNGIATVAVDEQGRIAALERAAADGLGQRVLMWEKGVPLARIDLEEPGPIYSVGLKEGEMVYLSALGWNSRKCHACLKFEELKSEAVRRKARVLDQKGMDDLLTDLGLRDRK